MALIRRADSATMPRDAVVLNLGDLRAQGESVKSRARGEAERIVREARAERARVLAGASEEGFATGLEEGRTLGREEGKREGHAAALAESRARLAELEKAWIEELVAFARARDDLYLGAKTDVLKLALLAAEKVTKRAIAVDGSLVVNQVAAVLSQIAKPTRLMVVVNPEDESLVREAMPELTATHANAEHIELATDAGLSRGSCVARMVGGGAIDASVKTQLDRIADALMPTSDDTRARDGGEA